MPLTLTLSPLAGRGDVPCERLWGTERSRHGPFAPFTGRRWRQPDEGPPRRKRRDVVSSRTGGTRPPVRISNKPSVTSVRAPKTLRNRTGRRRRGCRRRCGCRGWCNRSWW
ncbi:hypothetical protein GFL63_33685 [Rhizobium leguminosarum bv. viciae]|nr:hypothetical protein [Rhizobium leguminosarum bv. viciae]